MDNCRELCLRKCACNAYAYTLPRDTKSVQIVADKLFLYRLFPACIVIIALQSMKAKSGDRKYPNGRDNSVAVASNATMQDVCFKGGTLLKLYNRLCPFSKCNIVEHLM
jgi:hypothetical protein